MDSRAASAGSSLEIDGIDTILIRQELNQILESRHFRHSKRSCQFLQFVVDQKIGGREEELKERWIGVEIFGREVDYATGDDPVVRVQAGEVRRRLELYQADPHEHQLVSIELPVGSYVPVFHLRAPGTVSVNAAPSDHEHKPAHLATEELSQTFSTAAELKPISLFPEIPSLHPRQHQGRNWLWPLVIAVCAGVVLAVLGAGYVLQRANNPDDKWMNAFWGPVTATDKPVLICLGRPIYYQPSSELYEKYDEKHPGAFSTPMERRNRALPLDPQEPIRWGDLYVITNSGPAVGGVRAAMNISALFGHRNVPFVVRFGNDATFTELRESPAVIIGALNNPWMMQMSSDLHFAMQENGGVLSIHETGPKGRTWATEGTPTGWRDYGLVTRQLKGSTGQFTVKIEGISDGGTEAGSELLSNPQDLRAVLQSLPKGWEKKNLQLVVATDMIGGKPGPPQVVAYYVW